MRALGPQLQGLGSLTALASIHAPWGDHVLAPVPLLQRKRLCTAFQQLISQQTETENIHALMLMRTHACTRIYTHTHTHVLANTHTYTHTRRQTFVFYAGKEKRVAQKPAHIHTHKYTL